MAISFVVLDGELDRATRIRLAILKGSSTDNLARSVERNDIDEDTIKFFKKRGISISGLLALANGNGKNINDALFKAVMIHFNCYL